MDKRPDNASLNYPENQVQIDSLATKEAIEQLIGIFRRQFPVIVFISACAIALSLVYLFTTPKQYTAHTAFLIDSTRMKAVLREPTLGYELPFDDAQVETEIEVFKSQQIGLSVVKALKLIKNPEFVGSQRGFLGTLLSLAWSPFGAGVSNSHPVESENALTQAALGHFLSHRNIRRVGETYVLDISYTSTSPGTAATVANAIADAYLVGQLDAKYQASKRVSKWLLDRIGELRQQAMDADRAVLAFKKKNNIIDVGDGKTGNGTLLVDQRVADLNAQLVKAHADTDAAKANLDRIRVVMKEDVPDAAVADSLKDPIITQLLTQYLELQRRYNVYKEKYGPTHLAVVALQTQMSQLRQSMSDELARIAQSYQSNYAVAESREESLEKSLGQQIAGAQLTKLDQLGLDELESKAKAYHSAHDSFVGRYLQVTQQQSVPSTDARIITAATAPGVASSPNTSKILLVTAVLGLLLGFTAGYLREMTDNVFRTAKQVEQLLKTNCLTVLPVTKAVSASAMAARGVQKLVSIIGRSGKEVNAKTAGLFRGVIGEPLSAFAEGLRAVKVAADISGTIKQNKVIGVTSSLAHEGKSTVAANLAELIAHGGRKAILIDGDLRNPTLSRKLSPKADCGLLEVMGGKIQLQDAVYVDQASGLAFLPAVIESRLAHSSEILASDVFRQLIDGLRETYDYIIVDLSPLVPVVDARATTNVVDSYVFVVQWGQTKIKLVQRQLSSAPEIYDRLLGVVLNKANVRVLDRYEDYYGHYYYNKNQYKRYGYTR
jgi:polysaccharide biosynthesis transport protein